MTSGSSFAKIPAPPPEFTGRQAELALLLQRLDAYPALLVTGPPGVGKTSLLAAFARSLPEGRKVRWLDCRGPETASVLEPLEAARREGGLLFADGLERLGPEGATALLRAAAAAGRATALVAATRLLPALGPIDSVSTSELALGGLSPEVGLELLGCLASTGTGLDAARELVAATGGNPMALRVLAAAAADETSPERLRALFLAEVGRAGHASLLAGLAPEELRWVEALAVLDRGEPIDRELLGLCAGPQLPSQRLMRSCLVTVGTAGWRLPEPGRSLVLERIAPREREAWEFEAGRALERRGDWPGSLEHYCRARALGPVLRTAQRLAAEFGRAGRHAELLEHLERALAAAPGAEMVVLEARTLASLGRLREAIALVRKARERTAGSGAPVAVEEASLLACLAGLHWQAGESQRAFRAAYDALQQAESSGDSKALVGALELLSTLHLDQGDTSKALALLEHARHVGGAAVSSRSLMVQAAVEKQAGHVEAARRLYAEALQLENSSAEQARLGLELATLALELGEQSKARDLAATALGLARQSADELCAARALLLLARSERSRGATDQAMEHLNEALATAQGRDAAAEHTLALLERGELLRLRGDYRGAARDFGRAMAMASEVAAAAPPDRPRETDGPVRALALLGALAADRGEYARASEYYRQAMERMRRGSGGQLFGDVLCGLAGVCRGQGDYQTAAQLLEQGQRFAGSGLAAGPVSAGPSLRARVLLEKAALARVRGEYRAALEHCADARDLARTGDDRPLEARIDIETATIFRENGDYSKALEVLARALPATRVMGDRLGMALCLHELARSHQERGEYSRASRLYRRGLVMAQRMDAAQLVARFFNALAHIDADRGEYRSALTLYRRARLILRGLADRKETQRTLGGMADIYRNRREYPQALKLITECLRLAQSLPDVPGVARALAQMSAIHTLMGNHVQALQHQSRSLALKEELGDIRGIVESLTRLTRIHVSLGDFDRATPLLERGLKLSAEFGLARNEILLMEERAICELASGRVAEAEASAGEALSRAANLEFNEGLARGYRLMGLVHKRLNHYEVSQRHLNRALKHFKRLRRDAETEELLEEIRSVSRENLRILLGLREEMMANTRRLEDEILQRYGRRAVLLLAEIEGLAGSLGDPDIEPAMEAMQRQDEVLVPRLLCAGGTILRHVGDRVLARFDSTGPAVAAALAIQAEFDATPAGGAVARPRVRMAVHCGTVAEHEGQVSGQIVDLLGRLLGLASADGIIITGDVRDECGERLPVVARELPEQRTRGGGGPLRIYRLEAA